MNAVLITASHKHPAPWYFALEIQLSDVEFCLRTKPEDPDTVSGSSLGDIRGNDMHNMVNLQTVSSLFYRQQDLPYKGTEKTLQNERTDRVRCKNGMHIQKDRGKAIPFVCSKLRPANFLGTVFAEVAKHLL